jgi:hypothetical protein
MSIAATLAILTGAASATAQDPKTVQQQPADQAPPQSAPADPNAPPPTQGPTVTVGGGTAPGAAPKKDTPQAAEKKPEEAKPKPRKMAGSQVIFQTSANLNTFAPGLQQTQNSTVDSSLWLMPRYAINEAFQLRGRWILSYEYTNSDTTTYQRELRYSDPWFQLFYRKLPKLPGGINVNAIAQINPGISPESRARTQLFSPGVGLQLAKAFEHVAGGELMFILGGTYQHPIYTHTTPRVDTPIPYKVQCFSGTGCQDQVSGVANVRDQLAWSAVATGEWGKWSPGIFAFVAHQWMYQFRDIPGVTRMEDRAAARTTTFVSAFLDYHINDLLTAEIGYWMSRNLINGNGKYGNPLWDKDQDMRVYLTFNLNFDNLLKKIEGQEKGEGGIERANNNRRPFGAF